MHVGLLHSIVPWPDSQRPNWPVIGQVAHSTRVRPPSLPVLVAKGMSNGARDLFGNFCTATAYSGVGSINPFGEAKCERRLVSTGWEPHGDSGSARSRVRASQPAR